MKADFSIFDSFRQQPVLVTGHTGFKGTWLTLLLEEFGIPVVGLSLKPKPNSLFQNAGLKGRIPEIYGDIQDYQFVQQVIQKFKPSAIIHLAAQPLVLESYGNPLETFQINVMGTANILNAARTVETVKSIVVSTTDKVYRNSNSGTKFVENDPLEGIDPYSASKVATEAVIKSWRNLYSMENEIKLFACRAGNVIGGGDFAENRLIPDCVRGFLDGSKVQIRNAESVRPWQHVLEPLWGYLLALSQGTHEAYNFGPSDESDLKVSEVVEILQNYISFDYEFSGGVSERYESALLSLDSNLARKSLNWVPSCSQRDSIKMTGEWWREVCVTEDYLLATSKQIKQFIVEKSTIS